MELNYLFIGIVAFLLICAIRGYKKGFLRIVITLVGLVVIIMAVTVISPYVSTFLMEKTPVYDKVRAKVISVFESKNAEFDNSLPENQIKTIESYELPELITTALIENNTEVVYKALAVTVFEDYVSGYMAKMIIKAGSFIGLVAALWIVLWIMLFASDFLNKIPILRTFNRLCGMGTGLTVGIIIVWLFFLIVLTFLGDSMSTWMLDRVSESQLLTFLFNTNMLFRFIV